MLGKRRRLKRIIKNGRTIIVPMDHGVTKPEKGLENIDEIVRSIDRYIDAVVVHKGIAKYSSYIEDMNSALIVHLSGSTALSSDPNDKRLVTSVEKAIELGADAVSVHVNVGSRTDSMQIEGLGRISETCDSYGIPLLAMMYPRGERVAVNTETVKHTARIGYELGADIVKVPYVDNFHEVVSFCKIPVVVAGGSKCEEIEFYRRVETVIRCGAAGVAVGRNIFTSDRPCRVAEILHLIIHKNRSVNEVLGYEGNMVIGR